MNPLQTLEQLLQTPVTNEEFTTTLHTEKNNILSAYHNTLCTAGYNPQQYIFLQQQRLLTAMETISNSLPEEAFTAPQEDNNLLRLYHVLLDLLTYLETACPQYFDHRCKAPLIYLIPARQSAQKDLRQLRQMLSCNGAPAQLQDIILAPLMELSQASGMSYQRLYYLQALSKKLLEHPSEDVLNYMNYNNINYIQYRINLLRESIDEYPTLYGQLTHTKWLLKNNNQLMEHPHFSYSYQHPSLKEQIRTWLTEESSFLEHKMQYPDPPLTPADASKWHSFKLKLNLPVTDLACLVRLMIEYGLILNENKTEVAAFFAQFVSSSNNENISSGSLRHKMYSFPESAAEAIRNILLGLFNLTRTISSS